ncbi:hypothetical protein [Streptomyces sp. SID13726]|uniref:hypothetical protein n=1 Tax=Streptomyces sp. SID13726 TaxID=2706058 RepID=UPI0013BB42F0|nr:hypothetical protein [Streptomyces sp. SID13726]NEB00928.1 hypothetical protein [Streptomyces sp. SID13726]
MEAELVTLIGTGATTVVGLMVTDAWEQAKQRVARLLARGGEPDAVAGELEESRGTLVAVTGTADEADLTSDLTASIRLRLRRLLEQDPDAVEELRSLVAEFATDQAEARSVVNNSITGGTQHGPVVQGHTFTNLTFHTTRDAAGDGNG